MLYGLEFVFVLENFEIGAGFADFRVHRKDHEDDHYKLAMSPYKWTIHKVDDKTSINEVLVDGDAAVVKEMLQQILPSEYGYVWSIESFFLAATSFGLGIESAKDD